MILEYDPAVNLRHYPLPMRKYGLNPYGEPLYRIVFKDTRYHLVGGFWWDTGETAYHWVPKYDQVKSPWILERWYTASEFTRMSQSQWDSTMVDPISGWLTLGPYPSRGEYDLAWEFQGGLEISSSDVDRIVGAVEVGRRRSFQEVRDANSAEYEKEDRDTRASAESEIRDAVRPFGMAPISSLTGVARGSKTLPEMKTAEELGLPVPRMGGRASKNARGFDYRSSLSA